VSSLTPVAIVTGITNTNKNGGKICVVDTGGKFVVVETSGKFTTGVVHTGSAS
jgi:hypothetical protein